MNSVPQPGRQKQSQSPTHPQQMMPARPPSRPTQYPPRYYRPPAAGPSPSPKLGWTPRTAASPHTPVTPRTHSRPPGSATSHHPAFSQPLPAASPRLHVSASGTSKPNIKSNVTPIAIPPTVSAHTPSWLKGNYKPHTPKTTSAEPTTIEQLCEKRLEDIKKTINGENEDSELFQVMQKLDFAKVADEYARLNDLREIYFKGRERKRKAEAELLRAEREIQKIDLLAEHVNSKISRLRSYAKFIESGWVDEEALQQRSPAENGAKPPESINGDHEPEQEQEPKPKEVEMTEATSK